MPSMLSGIGNPPFRASNGDNEEGANSGTGSENGSESDSMGSESKGSSLGGFIVG